MVRKFRYEGKKISCAEAARVLGVSRQRASLLAKEGRLQNILDGTDEIGPVGRRSESRVCGMTAAEVASRFGVHRKTVHGWIKQGIAEKIVNGEMKPPKSGRKETIFQGKTHREWATIFGVARSTISNWAENGKLEQKAADLPSS